jgi:hypothetical protein
MVLIQRGKYLHGQYIRVKLSNAANIVNQRLLHGNNECKSSSVINIEQYKSCMIYQKGILSVRRHPYAPLSCIDKRNYNLSCRNWSLLQKSSLLTNNSSFVPNYLKSVQQQQRGLKVSALSLTSKRRHGQKITMITAYDFPSAIHVARANIDIVLVGDSVAMVELGHETTQRISMDDMIHHCTAVERGVSFANVSNPPLLVGDMPFGSYEYGNTDLALQNAYRFVKEAGMDAVKLEVRLWFRIFLLNTF